VEPVDSLILSLAAARFRIFSLLGQSAATAIGDGAVTGRPIIRWATNAQPTLGSVSDVRAFDGRLAECRTRASVPYR